MSSSTPEVFGTPCALRPPTIAHGQLQTQSAAGVSTVKFSGQPTIPWRQKRNLADRPTGSRGEPAPLLAFFCASSN